MDGVKSLLAYQKAYANALEIFEVSKGFPPEEKYSLTDQLRCSSRSVCINLAEAFRKRNYKAHFLSKLSDADMENSETSIWLDFARDCQYLPEEKHLRLLARVEEAGRLLGYMQQHPEKFLPAEKS